MVRADSLSYETVMSALERGDCYSSSGPTIDEISIEDGVVSIKCSDAVAVFVISDIREIKGKRASAPNFINEVSFDMNSFISEAKNKEANRRGDAWFRVEVIDQRGDHAWSRAYFVDELE
jgi:hypothetical protein